jgi:hypothetical protein
MKVLSRKFAASENSYLTVKALSPWLILEIVALKLNRENKLFRLNVPTFTIIAPLLHIASFMERIDHIWGVRCGQFEGGDLDCPIRSGCIHQKRSFNRQDIQLREGQLTARSGHRQWRKESLCDEVALCSQPDRLSPAVHS